LGNLTSATSTVLNGSAQVKISWTIPPATPSISTTQQPASAVVGSSIADRATVSGGNAPTGTVTFILYANPSGTGTPLFTDTEPLVGGAATSAGYTATATGTDYWVATYNGDADNNAVTSAAAAEPVTVTPATPSISTAQQPASATVGSSIADKATVTGGFNPTGTVTFTLFDNATASGTPLFTDTEPLVGGAATSAGYTATASGTDYWVATYNGDADNSGVTTGSAGEPVTVTPATPAISTTQQPASATVGSSIADHATVTGGFNPTGTVTFELYNNPNGTGTPLFTDTEPLVGGAATSAGYTATAAGTDYWVATYNGDSNNHGVTSGAAGEPVTVTVPADANISLSPSAATTPVALNETLTGHVNVAPDGTTFGNAPPGTVISFSLTNAGGATATFVGPSSCTTAGTTGSCQVTISSPTAGTTTVHATSTLVVGGTALTRATGDTHAGDGQDASATWESVQQQLTNLPGLIAGFGLSKPLSDDLNHRVAEIQRRLAQRLPVCGQLSDLLKAAIDQAQRGPGGLSFAEAGQLLDAVNAIGVGLGCVQVSSPRPQAEGDLVKLMATITGMGLAMPESDDLTNRARNAAEQVVAGSPAGYCRAVGDLADKIRTDTGKPNKLTATQGATLLGAVAAISGELGC
jgi:hypothetical protein